MTRERQLASLLVAAFLAGTWTARALLRRGRQTLPGQTPWMPDLVRHVLLAFPAPPADRPEELTELIDRDPVFAAAAAGWRAGVGRAFLPEPVMGPARWPVAAVASTGELADRLGVDVATLTWLADRRGLARHLGSGPRAAVRHYDHHLLPRSGGRMRLLESPRPRLRTAQRWVLREILDAVPPHPAAHGFRAGHSVLSYVAPHTRQALVLRFDLEDFFLSITGARVVALFRTLGYPAELARVLAALCTTRLPGRLWASTPRPATAQALAAHARTGQRLRHRHLPQGAPTSPAVANLCAHRLDVRLAALAAGVGAAYTRYADDLAFSGGPELVRRAVRLEALVGAIALEEGFALNHRKTRIMRAAVRQQLCGLVVNRGPNLVRDQVDRLKAHLYNCVRSGPASQLGEHGSVPELRAHLEGRVAWVTQVNPHRGARLRALLDRIVW